MPLFILWVGFGSGSKVALVTVIVFFLVFYSTYEGVRDVEQRLLDVLKVMDASRMDLHLKVRLPSAATWIIQGLRVSVPYALVAAVTAEIVGSNTGLGYLIQCSAGQFFTQGVFAGILVLVVISVAINALVTLLEQRLAAELKTRVASFAIPTWWRVQTESLPLLENGKIDKVTLAQLAAAEAAVR